MLKIIPVIGYTILSFLLPSSVHADTLENIQGVVHINKGDGYKIVNKKITIRLGDKIMTGLDGSARILYKNGTFTFVKPGRVTTVISPFKKPQTVGRRNQEQNIIRDSGRRVIERVRDTVSLIDPAAVLVGGVAIGGGIAAIISLSDDDKPASP